MAFGFDVFSIGHRVFPRLLGCALRWGCVFWGFAWVVDCMEYGVDL